MPESINSYNLSSASAAGTQSKGKWQADNGKGADFRDKYIASLEEQIQMYKVQISQNQIQIDKMQDQIIFYEEKLHEKFLIDMAAKHTSTSVLPSPKSTHYSLGDKRRISEVSPSDENSSRKSSNHVSYSPKNEPFHHPSRPLSSQSNLEQKRPILPPVPLPPQYPMKHQSLPRLNVAFNNDHDSTMSAPYKGHRFSFSGPGASLSHNFIGHSEYRTGHSRHVSADFTPPTSKSQGIYGWKDGPYGMEPLYPVKAAGPACDGCRLRKRKCGREKPHCSYCVRLHKNNPGPNPCAYPSWDKSEKRQKVSAGLTETSNPLSADNKSTVDNIAEENENDDSGPVAVEELIRDRGPFQPNQKPELNPIKTEPTSLSIPQKNSSESISPKSSRSIPKNSLENLIHAAASSLSSPAATSESNQSLPSPKSLKKSASPL